MCRYAAAEQALSIISMDRCSEVLTSMFLLKYRWRLLKDHFVATGSWVKYSKDMYASFIYL